MLEVNFIYTDKNGEKSQHKVDCYDFEEIKVGLNRTDMGDMRVPAYLFKKDKSINEENWVCTYPGKSLVLEKSKVSIVSVQPYLGGFFD